jgi:hypothetical protein
MRRYFEEIGPSGKRLARLLPRKAPDLSGLCALVLSWPYKPTARFALSAALAATIDRGLGGTWN